MKTFWSERARRFRGDPRANTNDIWLREIEISSVDNILKSNAIGSVLDFGCANGYTTIRLAKANLQCTFSGIDINGDMIAVAQELARDEDCHNAVFQQVDILQSQMDEGFDFIYAVRVFQNIESAEKQRSIFDRLYTMLKPNGLFYYIESYTDGYTQINKDRVKMSLPPLPVHPHLTLLTDEFDEHVSKRMELLERSSPSSSYYLITRLLYSCIAAMNKEEIDYNHPIHQVAAIVPQIGEYGPQRAALYRKRS